MPDSYEIGPIRPPSEAQSLLIRVTRNCPWNRCTFCHTYKGEKFSFRPVEEVKKDIDTIGGLLDEIRQLSWRTGYAGEIHPQLIRTLLSQPNPFGNGWQNIAGWLYFGGKQVFLQDANSLQVKTRDLIEIILHLKKRLPSIERVTTYARSKTAAQKSVAELKELHAAGLSRIHIGMETGCDPLLQFVEKGVTANEQVQGGRNVVESGISLCEYVMPGLGGKNSSKEHAVETANVLNQINPDFIRLRSLYIRKNMPLYGKVVSGEFARLSDDEVVQEIRLFITHLHGIQSTIASDHILNVLEEIQGKLPEGQEAILAVIDRYLALPDEQRLLFRLGRRMGCYRSIDDFEDLDLRRQVNRVMDEIMATQEPRANRSPAEIEQAIYRLMDSFI